MPDVFTKKKRSEVMSCIRGHGNKQTELALIKIFRENKITGWRRHQPLFGKPDFVFHHARLAIFVDGCFWHACPQHSNLPVQNGPFWRKKLTANQHRDTLVTRTLRARHWHVLRIWQHDLATRRRPQLLTRLHRALKKPPSAIPHLFCPPIFLPNSPAIDSPAIISHLGLPRKSGQ